MSPNNENDPANFAPTVAFTGRWKKVLLALGVVTVFLFTVNRFISTTLPLYNTDGNITEPTQQMTVLDILPYINLFAMLFVFQFHRDTPVRMFEIKSLKTATSRLDGDLEMKTWVLNSFGTGYALITILASLALVFMSSQTFERCSTENIKVHKTTTEAGLGTGPAELACTYARFANGSNLMDPSQLVNANTIVVFLSAVGAYYTFQSQDKFSARKASSASAIVAGAAANTARALRQGGSKMRPLRQGPPSPNNPPAPMNQKERAEGAAKSLKTLQAQKQKRSNQMRVNRARSSSSVGRIAVSARGFREGRKLQKSLRKAARVSEGEQRALEEKQKISKEKIEARLKLMAEQKKQAEKNKANAAAKIQAFARKQQRERDAATKIQAASRGQSQRRALNAARQQAAPMKPAPLKPTTGRPMQRTTGFNSKRRGLAREAALRI